MVSQCPSCVVRHAASNALKAYSQTPGPLDSKLGRNHRADLEIKNSLNRYDRKSRMAAMAAILKIYFSLLLLNLKIS